MSEKGKTRYQSITPDEATKLVKIKEFIKHEEKILRKKRDDLCRRKGIYISDGESLKVEDMEARALNVEIQKAWDIYCMADEALTAYRGLPFKEYMPYGEWYGYVGWLKKLGIDPDKGRYYEWQLRRRFNRARR